MRRCFFLLLLHLPSMLFGQRPELVVPIGHTSWVTTTAFSPDGQLILTGSQDATAKLWNLEGEELVTFIGHAYPINSAVFSPDGQLILTSSVDATAKLWNLAGEELVTFSGHAYPINSAVFSPDGQFILTSSVDATAKLWNLAGEELVTFSGHISGVRSVAFSPDNRTILTGSGDGTAKLWDLAGEELVTFSGHTSGVRSVAFSPDGQFILTGSTDKTAKLWNLAGEKLVTCLGHTDGLLSVAFSPDGQFILTGSFDKTAKLWNLAGEELVTCLGHTYGRVFAAFSPDGRTILTGSDDETAKLWNLAGEELVTFSRHTASVSSIAFSPDGQFILTGSADKTAKLWNLVGKELVTFTGKAYPFPNVAFLSDNSSILIRGERNKHKVWDLAGQKITTSTGDISKYFPGGRLNCGEFFFDSIDCEALVCSPNNHTVLTVEDGNFFKLRNKNGEVLYDFGLHIEGFYDAEFSGDGHSFFFIGDDDKVQLWNQLDEKLVTFADSENIISADFSPDCQSILTSSHNGVVKLWDVSGTELHTLERSNIKDQNRISVAFSSDNELILTSKEKANKINLWDRKNGKTIASLILVDSTDWIVTSPNGLFDASSTAMHQMHYSVFYEENQEYITIDIEQLKARYYEPGLLQKLLGYIAEPIRPVEDFKNLDLYPKVATTIDTLSETLNISLQERNGGIGKVSLFLNGKEVIEEVNPLPRQENAKRDSSIQVDLKPYQNFLLRHPDSTNTISIRAYNEEGWLKSKAINLEYKLPAAQTRGINKATGSSGWVGQLNPKLYVVSIGTSNYTGTKLDLQYADQDAIMMAKALQSVGASLFTNGDSLEVHCMTTDSTGLETTPLRWQFANKNNIRATFEAIKSQAKAEDVVVVYLSGHGVAQSGQDQTQFYYLTQGVSSEADLADPATLQAYTISSEELTKWINDIPALKQVLIIDACNSGQIVENLTGGTKNLNSSQIRALDRMKDRTGMFVLSGSASDKVSYEASQYGQGLLTYALLQGMRGVAARKGEGDKELIDVMKLFQYARDEVPRLASTINGIQTPMLGFPSQGASFDIGILDDKAKAKISIGHEKPIMIRSIFMNEATYKDDLQLVTLLESSFRKESAKGAKAQLIYVDVNDYPGAYALRGLYSIEGEKIKIKLKLFWGQESFDLAIPAAASAKELVGEIKWVVQEKIAELEGG